jgi:hypothetical protein
VAYAQPAASTFPQHVPLSERITICEKFVKAMEDMREDIAKEITMQMGRCAGYAAFVYFQLPILLNRCYLRSLIVMSESDPTIPLRFLLLSVQHIPAADQRTRRAAS